MIYKEQHRKLQIEEYEPHIKTRMNYKIDVDKTKIIKTKTNVIEDSKTIKQLI